ncbi:MAG: T9SS type A sorting domain-containing protein [Calditrichaeota bacterium]|nr:T9SS type A sorting domain-containing protein [Calditrichota bacterium]HQU73139.1 glucoamylase family protein [Calditrichia bacterium]
MFSSRKSRFKTLVFFLLSSLGSIVLAQSDIVIFTESPTGNIFYDYSWGFDEGSSYVELVNGPKFPVETAHAYEGQHALRLRWRSAAIGNWGIAVAGVGWPGNDITQLDSLTYWINGPSAIAAADLPDITLEDLSNRKSDRVSLGAYLSTGVDGDSLTWQKVAIPLADIGDGSEGFNRAQTKTIFHYQAAGDNVEHLAWLDEIRFVGASSGSGTPDSPTGISASGHDSRIDILWDYNASADIYGYYLYKSETADGPYTRVNPFPNSLTVVSDFFGENNCTFYYYATAANRSLQESAPSDTVSASSFSMTDEELMTSVQEATFRYFYHFGHPKSGMARERNASARTVTTGGSGFGLMAIVVGAERGFVSRDSAAARVLKMARFLRYTARRFHGVWSHWMDGETGEVIPFSQYDDGADLVETSFMIMGLLTARQYFTGSDSVETEIRDLATELWEDVEWDWFRRTPTGSVLYWHWSPNFGWQMNLPIRGFNETMIVYLLAIASPTHPVPASLYHNGWAGSGYTNGQSYYGHRIWVGPPYGGPLFFTHYSFMGFDPRNKRDTYCNYFNNNRNISLIHWEYAIENPYHFAGYDSSGWGLTASDDPDGYSAHRPLYNDNGTISPTAALSAMPYTPEQSIAAMKHFYHTYGADLWGEFGFKDAYNVSRNWFARSYLAIDQGPIVVMIENYRSQLCWNLFMSNPEIQPMMDAIGFTPLGIDGDQPIAGNFELAQNYPNPFNGETQIRFSLPVAEKISLEIFNVLGQSVRRVFSDRNYSPGAHHINLNAGELPSGIYFYRLSAGEHQATHKMLLVK